MAPKKPSSKLLQLLARVREEMTEMGITTLTLTAPAPSEPPTLLPGRRLKAWREAQGWTQVQLGQELGYATTPWERGSKTYLCCVGVSQVELGKVRPNAKARASIERLSGIPSDAWDWDR